MIKRNILLSVATVLVTAAGVAAAQGGLPGQSSHQDIPVGTQAQVEAGQAKPDPNPQPAATVEPTAAADDEQTTSAGAVAAVPTPAKPTADPAKIAEQTVPAPVLPPAPTRTGAYHMRFVDVSPANKPNSKADQYCDYAMSDGATDTVWAGSVTYNFTQPIANYNENNLPGLYSAC